jgi:hypothetical protein
MKRPLENKHAISYGAGGPAAPSPVPSPGGAEIGRRGHPGATQGRLAAIKARYDPTNLFRLHQTIPLVIGQSADNEATEQ